MFEDEPPFGRIYLIRKIEAFQKGQDDARFGNPQSCRLSEFSLDYNQGYEQMKKISNRMRAEEERQKQLGRIIDAIKMHKPLF